MMKKLTITHCPICGSKKLNPVHECKDYFALGDCFMIKECESCGFRFTDEAPSEDEIGIYYKAEDYVSHSDTQKGIVNKLYHFARNMMLRKKGNMVDDIYNYNHKEGSDQKKHILDIGAGTGYFLNEMNERGWLVEGAEKSDDARVFADKHFKIELARSIADYMGTPSNMKKYDIITLWHVLEHLENLNGSLNDIRSLLKDNGNLILALPNCASYDARKYKEYWAAYDVPRHLWHFTPETVSMVASKNGFEVERIAAMPLDAFYISMLSEKYKGNKLPFVAGMLTGMSSLLRVAKDPKQASSIIYVLKKRI